MSVSYAELLIDARVAAVLARRVEPAAVGRIDVRDDAVAVADREPVPHGRRGRAARSTGPSSARDPAGRRRCCTDPPCRRRSSRSRRPACSRSASLVRPPSYEIAMPPSLPWIIRFEFSGSIQSVRTSPNMRGNTRGRVPRLAAVDRMPEAVLRDEDVLIVVRVDADLAEVVRALRADVVVVGVHLRPRLPARSPCDRPRRRPSAPRCSRRSAGCSLGASPACPGAVERPPADPASDSRSRSPRTGCPGCFR